MENNRIKNASRNILWGTLNNIVNIVTPFITRTALIYILGTLYLGLNGLFASIIQVLNISELGVSSAIIFSMYKPMAEGNDKEVCALLNFYRKCYRIIGFVVLGLGLILLPFLHSLIAGKVPDGINIYLLYLMNLISTVLSYELFAYRMSLLVAAQRSDVVSKVTTVTLLLQFVLQLLVLFVTKNYYLFVLVIYVLGIAKQFVCAAVSKRLYPQFLCKWKITKEEIHDIGKRIGGMLFQKIGGVVLASVDTLVISAVLGLHVLALYQNYYYIITSLFGVLAVIMSSLVATVGNSIVTESLEKNYRDFKKFNFLYIWIVAWFAICLLCLYQPFMQLWVGKKLMLPFAMAALFALYFFVYKWCDILYVYQEACGIWWETKFIPLLAAILNLVVNIILVHIIGLPGILISTIVSVLFVYDFGYARVLFKVYFKSRARLFKYVRTQLSYLLSASFAAVLTFWLCSLPGKFLLHLPLLLGLFIKAVICLVVPNAVLLLLWHRLSVFREGKELLKKVVRGRLHR